MFAHRFLGSPQGKHFNSLEGNEWWKVGLMSRNTILESDYILSEMGLGDADIGEVQVFVWKIMKNVVKSID